MAKRQATIEFIGDASSVSKAAKETEQAAGKVEAAAKKSSGAVAKAAKETDDAASKVSASAAKSGVNLSKLTDASGKTGKAFGALGLNAKGLGVDLEQGPTAGALVAGAAIAKFALDGVSKFQQLGSEVLKFSRVAGTSAEESSKWVAVADDFEISSDQAAMAIGRLAKTAGSTPAALQAMGIEIAHNADGGVDLQATMLNVARAYSSTNDQAKRAALGTAAFGKSWQDLVPLLEQGADGLQQSLDGVSKTQILSAADLKKAEDYRLAMDNLSDAVGGLQRELGQGLIPALTEVANDVAFFTDKVTLLDRATHGGLFKALTEGAISPLGRLGTLLKTELPPLWAHHHDTTVQVIEDYKGQAFVLEQTAAHYQRLADVQRPVTLLNSEIASTEKILGDAMDDATDAAKDKADALQDVADAARDVAGTVLDLVGTERDYTKAQQDTKAADDALIKTMGDRKAKEEDKAKAIDDVKDAIDRQLKAAQDLAAQQLGPGADAQAKDAAGNAAVRSELEKMAAFFAGGPLAGYIDDITVKFDAVARASDAAARAADEQRRALERLANGPSFDKPGGTGSTRFASTGGHFKAGEVVTVGEQGFELFDPDAPGLPSFPIGLGGTEQFVAPVEGDVIPHDRLMAEPAPGSNIDATGSYITTASARAAKAAGGASPYSYGSGYAADGGVDLSPLLIELRTIDRHLVEFAANAVTLTQLSRALMPELASAAQRMGYG